MFVRIAPLAVALVTLSAGCMGMNEEGRILKSLNPSDGAPPLSCSDDETKTDHFVIQGRFTYRPVPAKVAVAVNRHLIIDECDPTRLSPSRPLFGSLTRLESGRFELMGRSPGTTPPSIVELVIYDLGNCAIAPSCAGFGETLIDYEAVAPSDPACPAYERGEGLLTFGRAPRECPLI